MAGAINRLRESHKCVEDIDYEFENIITEEDMLIREGIVEHCVKPSMIAIGGKCKLEHTLNTQSIHRIYERSISTSIN